LPRPTRGQLLAADAVRWLTLYRRSAGVERLDGRRALRSTCIQGWFPPYGTGQLEHGAALELGDGERVLAVEHHLGVLGPPRTREPIAVRVNAPDVSGFGSFHLVPLREGIVDRFQQSFP